jgi:hypothetical protein
MTWGSNPTHETHTCDKCGKEYTDDWNPPTHFMICMSASWWSKFRAWRGNHS